MVGPKQPHHLELFVRAAAAAAEIRAARLDLLLEPARPDAQSEPPARQRIDGGHPLGQHDRMVVGQHQHTGGQPEPVGVRGQKRQQVKGIRHHAVRGQLDPAGDVVWVDARVLASSAPSARPRRSTRTHRLRHAWANADIHPGSAVTPAATGAMTANFTAADDIAASDLFPTLPAGPAGLLHAHPHRRLLLDRQRCLGWGGGDGWARHIARIAATKSRRRWSAASSSTRWPRRPSWPCCPPVSS